MLLFGAGYYEVDVGLPAEAPEGLRIMAMNDMNNDKTTDLVTISADSTTVTVYYFDEGQQKYASSSDFTVPSGWYVDSVIPTNAQQDLQDLILTVSKPATSSTGSLETKFLYYTQTLTTAGTYTWKSLETGLDSADMLAGSQPMALDINGDQA